MLSQWAPAQTSKEGFMRVLAVRNMAGTAVAAGYSLRVLRLICVRRPNDACCMKTRTVVRWSVLARSWSPPFWSSVLPPRSC